MPSKLTTSCSSSTRWGGQLRRKWGLAHALSKKQYICTSVQIHQVHQYKLTKSPAYDSLQTESLELKTNIVAAYVMAELSKEVPALMSAMQVSSKQVEGLCNGQVWDIDKAENVP